MGLDKDVDLGGGVVQFGLGDFIGHLRTQDPQDVILALSDWNILELRGRGDDPKQIFELRREKLVRGSSFFSLISSIQRHALFQIYHIGQVQ